MTTITYQPQYRVHGTTAWTNFGQPVTATTVTISGLLPATSYDVQVVASDSNGSAASPVVTDATVGGGTVTLPSDSTGTTAFRIADMMERVGFNIYPDDGSGNTFGSAPADYTMSSIVAAYQFLTGSSGMICLSRVWCYYNYSLLSPFCPQLAAQTGTKMTMEVGGNVDTGTTGAVITMAGESYNGTGNSAGNPGWLLWSEGWNEPNYNGGETAAQTAQGDSTRKAGLAQYPGITLSSASIVIGLPNPEGYISGFLGSYQATVQASCSMWNVHYYPTQNADFEDGAGRGSEMDDVYTGINLGYGIARPQYITEWHPTLFYKGQPNYGAGGWDDAHDSYLTACFILSAFRMGYLAYIWYALYDFGTTYSTGLWPTSAKTDTPRGPAYVIRAMYQLTGDAGSAKHTFTQGRLNYSITGLQPPVTGSPKSGGQSMLFQASDGRYFLFVWNSQQNPGGVASSVTVTFNSHTMSSVAHYNLTTSPPSNMTPVSTQSGVQSLSFPLDASVHLLVITY